MSDLITRLEEAAEGSRELDEAIYDALGATKVRSCIAGLSDDVGGMWMYEIPGHNPSTALHVTTSLDAALALAERLDPGNGWERLYSGLMNWRAFTPAGLKRLPCLVCAAILKANHKAKP
jgi:hypothetical protein